MNKIQKRIGILFCSFASVLFLVKLLNSILNNGFIGFFTIDNLSYLFYSILFFITIYWESIFSKGIQISILLVESVLALIPGINSQFFGSTLLVIAVLLCYVYGFFVKYEIAKLIVTFIATFIVLLLVPLKDDSNKYLYAIEWDLFLAMFIFLLWFIFKDLLEKSKEYNNSVIKRYEDEMNSLENKLEIAVKTGIDLLDIIKSSNNHHRRKGDLNGE